MHVDTNASCLELRLRAWSCNWLFFIIDKIDGVVKFLQTEDGGLSLHCECVKNSFGEFCCHHYNLENIFNIWNKKIPWKLCLNLKQYTGTHNFMFSYLDETQCKDFITLFFGLIMTLHWTKHTISLGTCSQKLSYMWSNYS